MTILKKLGTFFTCAGLILTTIANCMKSVDTQGVWMEFDTKPYQKETGAIDEYTFSHNGEFFCGTEINTGQTCGIDIIASEKTKLHLWNINDFKPKITLKIRSMFRDYFFSPQGNFLVIKETNHSNSGSWKIYSLSLCKEIASFSGSSCPLFFPDEKFVSISDNSNNFTYKIFSIGTGYCKKIQTFDDIAKIEFSNPISCHNCVATVQYYSGILELFTIKKDCTFKGTGLRFQEGPIFEFIPNSNLLKIIKYPNKTCGNWSEVWNTNTGEKIQWNNDLVFSPDRKTCVILNKKNNQLSVFEKMNGNIITFFENIKKFSFSENGTFLNVLSFDKTLTIWNIQKQKPSATAKNVTNFKCLGCDTYLRVEFENEEKKIYTYKTSQTPFNIKNYTFPAQQNNIKKFFSGKIQENIKYSDLNILF